MPQTDYFQAPVEDQEAPLAAAACTDGETLTITGHGKLIKRCVNCGCPHQPGNRAFFGTSVTMYYYRCWQHQFKRFLYGLFWAGFICCCVLVAGWVQHWWPALFCVLAFIVPRYVSSLDLKIKRLAWDRWRISGIHHSVLEHYRPQTGTDEP